MLFGGLEIAALVIVFLLQIYIIKNRTSYEDLFSSESVRNGVYGFLILILAISYVQGGLNADRIIEGRAYMQSVVNGKESRFVGHAGDNMFFYSDHEKEMVVFRLPDGESLNFSYFPNPPGNRKTPFEKLFPSGESSVIEQKSELSNKASKGTQ